jgi:hypothetical protein
MKNIARESFQSSFFVFVCDEITTGCLREKNYNRPGIFQYMAILSTFQQPALEIGIDVF